ESILSVNRHADELPASAIQDIPVYVVDPSLVSQIVGYKFHSGMLACGRRPASLDLNALVGDRTQSTIAVCPVISDPVNLGGIVRTCCALGVNGLMLGTSGTDPYSRRVVRVSMGSVFKLPIRVSPSLASDLRQLERQHGVQLIATVTHEDAQSLPQADRGKRIAVLFGGEDSGLDDQWTSLCNERVTLPMQRETDSLNVVVATGIILHHFLTVANIEQAK
ncbi:unnamed protein product, partial [marine sediment metagenome]